MVNTDSSYDKYFQYLINGKRNLCSEVLDSLISSKVDVHHIYLNLFQKSLYQVGLMWEQNKISVATEHLATSITENLMNKVYEMIPSVEPIKKTIVITSVENETHQIGGKMVADLYEMHGWEAIFLGGNIPANELVDFVELTKPDLLGLSMSVYFHMDTLVKTIDLLNKNFKTLPITVGGQAFQRGGHSIIDRFENTSLVLSMDELETSIINFNKG